MKRHQHRVNGRFAKAPLPPLRSVPRIPAGRASPTSYKASLMAIALVWCLLGTMLGYGLFRLAAPADAGISLALPPMPVCGS